MQRASLALLLVAMLLQPAAAQTQEEVEDLRPENWRFDNLGLEDLPIGPVPTELMAPTVNPAEEVSDEVFGGKVDIAYGAFQRGFFLTALELALPRAERNDAAAQTLIAQIYAGGLGVPMSMEKAASWYRLASNNGDPLATFELALLYQSGRGVERDRARAAELFRKASDAGNIAARYNLGLLHVEGVYAEPSLVKAAQMIGEAATAGLPEARYDYGSMLMEGAGVAPDPMGAAVQFQLAAEDGLVAAQIEYATLLYLGRGVERDREAAAQWYRRAADAGNPVAQNRVAKLLAAGEGVAPDPETAAMYRALARRQGLSDPQLDGLLLGLPAEVLASAEERARFWPSRPPTRVAALEPPATP